MSRSALARQLIYKVREGGGQLPTHIADPLALIDDLVPQSCSGLLPLTGNERTMNIENVLVTNIVQSKYFRNTLIPLSTFQEWFNEASTDGLITHVQPWEPGVSHRTPSKAYLFWYRLALLRITEKQLVRLLSTENNHLRALGCLYLRYTYNPSDLWLWFEPLVADLSDYRPWNPYSKETVPFGTWVQLLLQDYHYGAPGGAPSTILPRIPVNTARDIAVYLAIVDKDIQRYHRYVKNKILLSTGTKVRARFSEDGKMYPATVENMADANEGGKGRGTGKVWVKYDEFGNTELRHLGQIELLDDNTKDHSSSSSSSSFHHDQHYDRPSSSTARRSRSRSRSPHDRSTRYTRDHRDRSRSRSPRPRSYRSRSRSNDRDRYSSHHRDDRDRYSSSSRSGYRDYKEDNYRSHSDYGNNSSSSSNVHDNKHEDDELESIRQSILAKEKQRALASGKDYAARPLGYKESLSASGSTVNVTRPEEYHHHHYQSSNHHSKDEYSRKDSRHRMADSRSVSNDRNGRDTEYKDRNSSSSSSSSLSTKPAVTILTNSIGPEGVKTEPEEGEVLEEGEESVAVSNAPPVNEAYKNELLQRYGTSSGDKERNSNSSTVTTAGNTVVYRHKNDIDNEEIVVNRPEWV